jgi:hypothetical protein
MESELRAGRQAVSWTGKLGFEADSEVPPSKTPKTFETNDLDHDLHLKMDLHSVQKTRPAGRVFLFSFYFYYIKSKQLE